MEGDESDTTKLLKDDSYDGYGTVLEIGSNRVSDKWEKKQQKAKKKWKNQFSLLIKFATPRDVTLMIFGSLFAMLSGALLPILGLFFGSMTNAFISQATYGLIPDELAFANNNDSSSILMSSFDSTIEMASERNDKILDRVQHIVEKLFTSNETLTTPTTNSSSVVPITVSQFHSILNQYLIVYLIIGTLMLLFCFLQTLCWELASEHIVFNIRKVYLSQILRQDISWYDQNDNGNLSNKLADDAERIREGTGYKCAHIIQYMSTFVAGIVVGLAVNYHLTLVILCVTPFLICLTAVTFKFGASSMIREQEKYAAAGYVAEEALSNIKTVNAFGGQAVEVKKYDYWLEEGRKTAMKKYRLFAFLIGLMFFIMYGVYALGFAVGSYLIRVGISTAGSVFTVFFSVVIGSVTVGQSLPYWNVVSGAVGILASISDIVERKVVIDSYSKEGRKASKIIGNIEFKNTSFAYPSRPEILVLDGFNLKIEPGKQIAIVGSSGAGKSTIVSLILRFYDPTAGEVYIDDVPVKDYNIRWLRQQIGLVSQEPVLFGVSIAENIRYGADGVNRGQIIEAAMKANAHDFILSLPEGYETLVGDTGSQLSGGQKQRIAIARALVRDPKILLLDEATSALDALSEGIVQDALENVMGGRTTIIVAHRLSTIRNADMICVMQKGKLVECGTHVELMNKKSHYFDLIEAQTSREKSSPTTTESEETLNNDAEEDEVFLTPSVCESKDDHNVTVIESNERTRSNRTVLSSPEIPKSLDTSAWQSVHEENIEPEWKVLDRKVSSKVVRDNDSVYMYETRIVRVKETREILYSDEEAGTLTEDSSFIKGTSTPEENKGIRLRRRKGKSTKAKNKKEQDWSSEVMEREMSVCELIKIQLPEWPWLLMGIIGFVGCGLVTPLFALYYGAIFEVFTLTGDALENATVFWTYMFVLFALFCGITYFIQVFGITYSNEKVIARSRSLVFENILRQPVGWFDLDSSAPGVLVNRLARNAPLIKAATGLRAGQVLASSITIVAATIIAIVCGWRLALFLIFIVPLIIALSVKQQRINNRNFKRDMRLMDNAGRIASETVRNVRTVQALGRELLFTEMYAKDLEAPYKEGIKQAFLYSSTYGLTQGLSFYMYAIAFRIGGYLIETGEMNSEDMYRVFFALSLCANSVGMAFSYMQDYNKARLSVRLLNYLLKRQSEIDSSSKYGAKPDISGTVEFKDVSFVYPSRPSVKVLRGLSLSVEAGKTLALVGESGCGKSTVISLLERFYDPKSGTILVDGYDIRTLNLGHLRSKIGLVTQEPILFNTSIKDNIEYGAVALQETVPFEQIKNAAKLANIHDFIMSLPNRYDTLVGERGVQLSGGQKQRVAIARALIRNPKILLLDEATSALDTESEKIVQAALDEAKIGRTCIVVAHRLSTIQNADVICVVDSGKIVERGTHAELEALRGHYFQLTQRQTL